MAFRRFFAFSTLASALAAAPAVALAAAPPQISETERAAARQLYHEGDALQQEGKYAEALDKFERAQKVVPAPTNLLRIAQCQAMLGRLVESAETYRSILRAELPPNAPPQFAQAVARAKAELVQVEPRVPKVKIDVTPKDAPNMEVRLDGKSINAALIGEPLPLDPGTHTIAVSASGYATDEQSVTVKESEAKSLAFTLKAQSAGGVAVVPGGASTASSSERPPPPPPIEKPPEAEASTRSKKAVLLGVKLGLDVPGGAFVNSDTAKISNVASTGAAGALEAGIRLWDHWYFGAFYEAAGFGQGGTPTALVGTLPGDLTATSTMSSSFGGLDVAWISNAHGLGVMLDIGLGYRSVSQVTKISGAQQSLDVTNTFGGGELLLGGGVFIKATSWLRIVPKITTGLGAFTHRSVDCSTDAGGAPVGTPPCESGAASVASDKQTGHAFVFIGVSGLYNIDLK